MSLYSKQFLLSPVKLDNTTKSLTNKLVSLPPETFSNTSTSPNYGISSDTSIGKNKTDNFNKSKYFKDRRTFYRQTKKGQ